VRIFEGMRAMPEATRARAPSCFFFVTPVWGHNHLTLFLEIGLPSLLAPDNLPGLSRPSGCRFLIYTRECDEASLTGADVFARLSALMPVEVHRIPEPLSHAHRVMSDCHMAAMHLADTEDAATVFVPPDCVWSNGSMVRMERLAKVGKSLVHVSGIRLDRDAVVPQLREYLSTDHCILDVDPRPLVSLGLKHLHTIAFTHFWREYRGGLMPANLYWTVAGEGLALRCFHLHPLMVKPQRKFARCNGTIDDDLGPSVCPDESRDYVVTDSDEIQVFELSGPERIVLGEFVKDSVDSAAGWMEVGTNTRHHQLATHAIRVHSGSMTDAKWQAIEQESDTLVAQLLKLYRSSSLQLALKHPLVLHYRDAARRHRYGRFAGDVSVSSRFAVKTLAAAAGAHRLMRVLFVPRIRGYEPRLVAAIYQHSATLKKRLTLYDSAIEDYTKAIARFPSSPLLYLLRGRAHLLKRDLVRAAEDLQAGLEISPGLPPLVNLLEKIHGDGDIVREQSNPAFEGRPLLFSSDGGVRFFNPRWMIYRSLLPLLREIIRPDHKRILLVGGYGYLRRLLQQQLPAVTIWAVPPGKWQALTYALTAADWDLVIWNDIECGPRPVSDNQLLKLCKGGNRVVCVVASRRRRDRVERLGGEARLLPQRSARFCAAVVGSLFRAQARLLDLAWREHGKVGQLLNTSAVKISKMSVLLGPPLNGIGSLVRLIEGAGRDGDERASADTIRSPAKETSEPVRLRGGLTPQRTAQPSHQCPSDDTRA
jgi:tetratricopeptide (TPR) repeat protein